MIFKKQNITFFLIILIISCFIFSNTFDYSFAKTKSKSSKVKQSSKKTKTTAKISKSKNKLSKSKAKTTKSKKKKRRRVRKPPFRETNIKMSSALVSISDSSLDNGTIYHHYLMGSGKYKHCLHVVELDLTQSDSRVQIMKAYGMFDELQKLQEMTALYDSVSGKKVLAAVNGNFWSAYKNYPIGPVISDGEVVEMNAYKLWSSGLFNENGELFIDNFFINGKIYTKKGDLLNIRSVNRRKDSLGIAVYNHFAGASVPNIETNNVSREITKAISETEIDSEFNDSTEAEIDTNLIKNEILQEKQIEQIESRLPKYSVSYLEKPAVNKEIKCLVIRYNESVAAIHKNGCVISLGRDIPKELFFQIGDTIYLKYETDEHNDVIFTGGVSGTPRLVRNGTARHEAEREGSHGGRFIRLQLPRTSIGTDREGTKIFLVVVEGTGIHANCFGANLSQLSLIMKRLGCYNAMNLDGGGSTIMVINGKNVILKNHPEASRRLSVGVAISGRK